MANPRTEQEPITTTQADDLRKTVVACLGIMQRQEDEGAPSSLAVRGGVAEQRRQPDSKNAATATPLDKPEAKAVVKYIAEIVSAAHADAASVSNHLNNVVEHLRDIGCTDKADVESYFRLANRALASLYFEAAKAHPSPSELTKFALRYALDARRPIEGDVDRFQVRPLEKFWEVVEYPSVARRVPAIPFPGRIVKNVFAVRILDCLQQRPPDFFGLMGLIESVLCGVPSPADCLSCHGDAGMQRRRRKIEVNLEGSVVWLDGEAFHVKAAQAYFVRALVSADGAWISSAEIAKSGNNAVMIGPRPDRVRAGLPPPIQELVESRGGRGFRLRLA